MSLSTLEVLYAAKARLENPRTKWEFTHFTTCTCGHIYAAATGRRGRESKQVLRALETKHADLMVAVARALGYEDADAEGAVWFVSDATYDLKPGDQLNVSRQHGLAVINEAIAKIEAQQEKDRLDVLAQARRIVDNAPLEPVAA